MPITQEELGTRVRQARDSCKLTQEDVAVQLGLSRSAIALIESGKRRISSLELEQLSYVLGRDVRSFLADDFTGEEDTLAALFRRHPDMGEHSELLAVLRRCLHLGREISNLEALLELDRATTPAAMYPVREPKTRWDAIQQGERTANEERRRLGLGDTPVLEMAAILEMQGVRTAVVDLPGEVSGLTLADPTVGPFIVVNRQHVRPRRRFSYAHEYAHVLLDRETQGTISRTTEQDRLPEVRANAFAAAFLMPETGLRAFVAGLGKGRESRSQAEVWAEQGDPIHARARTAPNSQDIQMYDVVLIAHHFGTSVSSAIYRLKNLRLISDAEFERLKGDEPTKARTVARALSIPHGDHDGDAAWNEFVHRLLGLGIEAFRRNLVSRAKLFELAGLLDVSADDLDAGLQDAGLEDEPVDTLVPEP